jgi:hypothetical protein
MNRYGVLNETTPPRNNVTCHHVLAFIKITIWSIDMKRSDYYQQGIQAMSEAAHSGDIELVATKFNHYLRYVVKSKTLHKMLTDEYRFLSKVAESVACRFERKISEAVKACEADFVKAHTCQ